MTEAKQETISWKQPKALWWLSISYALFMSSVGALMSSLTIYLVHFPGLGLAMSYQLVAIFFALLWILPLFGGYISERFGYWRCSILGFLLAIIGLLCFAFKSLDGNYIALSFFLCGNALLTPSLWCVIDHLYPKNSKRREAGFTYLYLIFNIGVTVGILVAGWVGMLYGYDESFILSAGLCLLGLFIFLLTKPIVHVAEDRSIEPIKRLRRRRMMGYALVIQLVLVPLLVALFFHVLIATIVMWLFVAAAVMGLIKIAWAQPTLQDRRKVYGFLLLSTFAVVFWILYSLEPSLLSIFVIDHVDKQLFGLHIPASSFYAFSCIFIVILGIVYSWVWKQLAKANVKVNLFIKFALGAILIGLAFLYLNTVQGLSGFNHTIAIVPYLACYILFAAGELFIGPLGISMAGQLAPEGREGFMVGCWQMSIAAGALFTAPLEGLTIVPKGLSLSQSGHVFGNLFLVVGASAVVLGIVIALCARPCRRLLGG